MKSPADEKRLSAICRPEGRSPSGAAPQRRKGGHDEALRPVGAPVIGSKVPSATPDGVNHLTSPRRAKVSVGDEPPSLAQAGSCPGPARARQENPMAFHPALRVRLKVLRP